MNNLRVKTPGGPGNEGTHNTVNLTSRSFTGILQEIPGKVPSAFLLGVGGRGGANLKQSEHCILKKAFPRGKLVLESNPLEY